MKRWLGVLLSTMAIASMLAEDELPAPEEGEAFEVEPPLLIHSRGPDGLPNVPAPPEQADVAKIESDLTKAKKSAAGGERLYKAGIIAKVESEERVLKVVRLEAKLAEARLALAKSKIEEQKTATTESSELATSEAALALAAQTAERAAEERRRAEMEAAFRNLQRQQKLLALGSGRRADVNRAEKKLAELQGAGN